MRLSVAIAVVSLLLVGLSMADDVRAAIKKPTDIPAQTLTSALEQLAKDRNFQVVYVTEDIGKVRTAGAVGEFTSEEVLKKLLTGTGFTYRYLDEKTVTIVPAASTQSQVQGSGGTSSTDQEGKKNSPDRFPLAQVDQGASSSPLSVEKPDQPSQKKPGQLEEVVVTGTHIHGTKTSPSPVHSYTRDDVDQTGVATVEQFFEHLPQNFANTSQNTMFSGTAISQLNESVLGTGVNLRGLGADSTLVLVNGRRVAPGNLDGNYVDVSMIPLFAVDRIDVVPDGASAIYGSDAVGGVVNIILRKNFDGSETRARYGSVAHGGREEYQVGETLGRSWEGGSALVSYEYLKETPLDAKDRSYTQAVFSPSYLLPKEQRHGLFLAAEQDWKPGVTGFVDSYLSKRTSTSDISEFLNIIDIQSYSATVGGRTNLSKHLNLELSATYGKSDTAAQAYALFPPVGMPETGSPYHARTTTSSVDATLTGSLFAIPAGPILYAAGGQYRRETYAFSDSASNAFKNGRNVLAQFVELRVPLVGSVSNDSSGNRLELTLADRNERYSDFGSTNNPKAGLIWQPTTGVSLRGTYGTSFKAPALSNLNPIPSQVVPIPTFDPQKSGTCTFAFPLPTDTACTDVLFVNGGNPQLRPEKAKAASLGVDWKPLAAPGVKASVTYYLIRYDQRIVAPQAAIQVNNALVSESALGPSVIIRNPSQSLIQQYTSGPGYSNPLGIDFGIMPISAIADYRFQNLSSQKTHGLDFGLSYVLDTRFGATETGVDGAKIFEYKDRFSSATPYTSILNIPNNPIDLRLRAREVVKHGNATLALFANYVDSYANNVVGADGAHISSWTTFDATISYELSKGHGYLSGFLLTLGATNIADRNPPFVKNFTPGFTIDFDGANANALGRFVFLQLSKR